MENQSSNMSQGPSSTAKWIAIAIIIASLIIGGSILYTRSNSNKIGNILDNEQKQNIEQQPTALSPDISKVKTEGSAFIGNFNAPIVIATWGDYKCSFCKKLEDDAINNIIKDYIDSGKVKIIFKNYQFLSDDSQIAGIASRAVWEIAPNKFHDWHKSMYSKQGSSWGSRTDILALTKSLGIDSLKIEKLMNEKNSEYQKFIDAEKAEALAFGIKGTPGTIIGKELISGAQPYSAFKTIIDQMLSQ